MKKYLLFLIFLLGGWSFGQAQEYALWVSTQNYQNGPAFPTGNIFRVTYRRQVDNEEHFDICCGLYLYPTGKHIIPENEFPLPVIPSSSSRGTFGILCQYQSPSPFTIDKLETFTFGFTSNPGGLCLDIASKNPDDVLLKSHSSVILPNYVQPVDDVRDSDEKLFKDNDTSNNFNDPVRSISQVSWSYNYNNQGYRLFPTTIRNSFPMNATIADILVNESFQTGGTLRIRYELEPSSNLPTVSSDEIFINLIASPPSLVGSPVTTNTSCANISDGSVTLTFNQNIANSEQMRFYLYSASADLNFDPSITNPPQTLDDDLLSNLVDVGGGDFSGSFKPEIPEGEYVIIYQVLANNGTVTTADFTSPFTIERPAEILVSIPPQNIIQPQCFGDTGTVTLIGEGGGFAPNVNATLEYGIDGDPNSWQPSPIFSNLQEGNYIFIARTSDECFTTSQSVTISVPTAIAFTNPMASLASSSTTNDAVISIEFAGGTPSTTAPFYSFELSRQNASNGFDVVSIPSGDIILTGNRIEYRNLGIGNYRITITDANGCPLTSGDIEVTTAPIPTLGSPTITPITCNGANDATITVTADFPTVTTFSYELRDGTTVVKSDTNIPSTQDIEIVDVAPGNYILYVIASTGDFLIADTVASVTIPIIPEPAPLTVVITAVPFSCSDSTNGALTVVASGATNYQYELSTNRGVWFDLIGNTISVDSPNFYEITLRDANNTSCESQISNQVEVTRPTPILVTEISTSHINVSTNGGNDGAIGIEVSGGTPIAPSPEYIFSWSGTSPTNSSFTSTSQNISNLFAGSYQVIVSDANLCESLPLIIEITEPGPLDITDLTSTDTCNGLSTGTITAIIQGTGDIRFEFLLQPGQVGESVAFEITTADRTVSAPNLAAGTYGLRITEVASGNIITTDPSEFVTITELSEITADVAKTDVSCDGFTRGTITVSGMTGGSPFTTGPNAVTGYEYRIDDTFNTFQPEPEFNNVAAGDYIVTVRDVLGCEYSETIRVDSGQVPVLDENATNLLTENVTSAGASDGSITLVFPSGTDTSNYTYNWTGPNVNGTTTQNLTGLTVGIYEVTIMAPGNCILIRQFTITEQQAFSVQSITGTPTCFGQNNGALTAIVEATGSVIHNWRNSINDALIATETTTVRTVTTENLAAGTYYLEIDDGSTTARSTDFEILELSEVTASIAPPTDSCPDNDTGTIVISNPTGSLIGSYEYSIDDGNTFQASPLFENLAQGPYTVRVRATDNPNCDFIVPNVVVQASPRIVWDEPNTIMNNVSAAGQSDGSIAPIFTGGAGVLTYSWAGPSITVPTTTQNITGLAAGMYTVTVTDGNSCELVQNFEVQTPGPLTITNIIGIDVSCSGEANGSITTSVNGEGTITYLWTLADGSAVPVSNGTDGEDITGILAGNYILTVTDDNTTVVSAVIPIGEPATALTIQNINNTNSTCNGEDDGTIQIVASGGTAPYEYSINGVDFENNATFMDLSVGQYTVTVRDGNGCTTTQLTPILITEPEALDFTIVEQRPLTAANAADGAIIITASGGSGDYTYSWTGPNFTSTDKDIFNLEGGDYILTLTDANNTNCTFISTPITITEPGVLIVTNTQTVLLECNGDDFGEITANAQGGILPYTYQWFQIVNGNNNQLTEDTDIIANLSAGTYFVRVTDANNIVADAMPAIIDEPQLLEIIVDDVTNVLCSGEATGAIAISVTGGTTPYQFIWSNGDTVDDINNLEVGDYTIEIVDGNGCISEETITITTPPDALQIADVSITNVSTFQGLDGSIALDINGGTAPYTIVWTRLSDNSAVGNQDTLSNLAAGSYSVSITDANGCNLDETYEVTQPDIVEETIIQPTCAGESNGSISLLVNEGNGIFTYDWSTGATTNSITGLSAGSYTVTITGFGNGPLTRTYVIEDPLPLEVDLGDDRVLCADQVLELDATVADTTATYQWTSDNGFTSTLPNVSLTETGNYTVIVRSQTGCTAEGTIFVDISSDEINAEFAVSSQVFVGETIVAVDISFPLPETIVWEVPASAQIIKQDADEIEFSFDTPGEYEIGITTTRGDCIAQKTKKILVVARDGAISEDDSTDGQKLVEDFIVYPNPTSGQFTADVNLTERGNVSIKVFSFANNALITSVNDRGEDFYSIPFDISGMPTGVYAVLLETPYGTSLRKVIVR